MNQPIQIIYPFKSSNALVCEDNDHDEPRFVLIGMANCLLVVVYCYLDDENIIRLILARLPTKKERQAYER